MERGQLMLPFAGSSDGPLLYGTPAAIPNTPGLIWDVRNANNSAYGSTLSARMWCGEALPCGRCGGCAGHLCLGHLYETYFVPRASTFCPTIGNLVQTCIQKTDEGTYWDILITSRVYNACKLMLVALLLQDVVSLALSTTSRTKDKAVGNQHGSCPTARGS
jgi:hypothetical protein